MSDPFNQVQNMGASDPKVSLINKDENPRDSVPGFEFFDDHDKVPDSGA